MQYLVTADTDVGIRKRVNQDSVLIKHGRVGTEEILFCLICDGMGGLSKGELASATVIRAFSDWFDWELPKSLDHLDLSALARRWEELLLALNDKLKRYGQEQEIRLGTTFSGLLLWHGHYLIGHVGDTRIYHLDRELSQLTEDHTLAARELRRGRLSPEEARRDQRRSVLLQCIGASPRIRPQFLIGEARPGAYLLCSDGFRNEVMAQELLAALSPEKLKDKSVMHRQIRQLISLIKERREKDNISAILVKAS